jgi:DNA-binding transcriptional MocR family regulator
VDAVEARALAGLLGAWTGADLVLYRSLALRLGALIRDGRLPPGTRLPSERKLAEALHVSRGTVLSAYAHARDEGLLETLRGSGTVVRAGSSFVSGPREAHIASALPADSVLRGPRSLDGSQIDLRGAYWFGSDDLDADLVGRVGRRVGDVAGGHGYEVLGLPSLRAAIAAYLSSRDLPTVPEQVLVTTGAQQAIALTAQLHVGVGDEVLVEDPTFAGAVEALVAQQATIHTVPVGPHGVDLVALDAAVRRWRPRLTYLLPTVHNPSGVTLPGPARHRLVELIAGWDTIVVDDTTLAETVRSGPVPRPLAADAPADVGDRIVTIGSLSKVAWGGLRIGWARADERTIGLLGRVKAIADLGSSVLSQLAAEELLRDVDAVAARRRAELEERHRTLTAGLTAQLPDWRWRPAGGGLCLWVELAGADAAAFASVAAAHGVAVLPGPSSSAHGGFGTHLRLPFGQPPAVLRDAVTRLAAAWEEDRRRREGASSVNLSVVV